MQKPNILDLKALRYAFNRAAQSYNQYDFIQKEIANRLLQRLDYIRLNPKIIVDCSARTGYLSEQLTLRFPTAQIISVECAEALLKQGTTSSWKTQTPICAWPNALPLPMQSVDLIIGHLVLHWVNDEAGCLLDWQALLKPQGLLLFSTLGLDTLSELSASFAATSTNTHIHPFYDIHPLGDVLLAQRWLDPVVDHEWLTLYYRSPLELLNDLRKTGTHQVACNRVRHLTGKQRWQNMLAAYSSQANADEPYRFPATFEVIYGHAFCPQETAFNDSLTEFTFSVNDLHRNKK